MKNITNEMIELPKIMYLNNFYCYNEYFNNSVNIINSVEKLPFVCSDNSLKHIYVIYSYLIFIAITSIAYSSKIIYIYSKHVNKNQLENIQFNEDCCENREEESPKSVRDTCVTKNNINNNNNKPQNIHLVPITFNSFFKPHKNENCELILLSYDVEKQETFEIKYLMNKVCNNKYSYTLSIPYYFDKMNIFYRFAVYL